MAISVDPLTFIISVPKSDLTLVQSTPTEIYNMDLNWFRLALKDWEDDDGITFLKTHTHNTEVSLGGLTFARVIEILPPYTITFENGTYAVNLIVANSNVGDRVNVNNVSIRSQNSAGLISSPDIEYASFQGGVTIDIINGVDGTTFPRGTDRMPVNNVTDALLIATYRGFHKLYVKSDMTIDSGSDLSSFLIEGESHVGTQLVIDTNANVSYATFRNCEISGVLDGDNTIEECVVGNLNYVNGHIHDSSLKGTITLAGSKDAYINNCARLDINIIPVIDMGGSGQDLVMPNYAGVIKITNLTGPSKIGIGLNSGNVILDSTSVTAGNITVSGVGRIIDENGNRITSGVWNGGVTIQNYAVNKDLIAEAVWEDPDALIVRKMLENKVTKVGDVITIYEDNGTSVWRRYNLASGGRVQI